MKNVGEELMRTVGANQVDKAVAVEQAQQVQADYFKRMVMGQIGNSEELNASPSMKSLQKSLLAEISAQAEKK
jgi:hypothetical protein